MNDQSLPDHVIEKTATEARQGVTPGWVRRVLVISLTAVVVAMAVAFWAMHR